jgi:hypothetical protein
MAGEDNSFFTGPLHCGQVSTGGSENFWIRSKR